MPRRFTPTKILGRLDAIYVQILALYAAVGVAVDSDDYSHASSISVEAQSFEKNASEIYTRLTRMRDTSSTTLLQAETLFGKIRACSSSIYALAESLLAVG